MGVQIAHDPATTVKKDQHRKGSNPFWGINSDRNFATRARYSTIFYVGNWLFLSIKEGQLHFDLLTDTFRGEGRHGRGIGESHKSSLRLRVERHKDILLLCDVLLVPITAQNDHPYATQRCQRRFILSNFPVDP